MLSTFHPPGLAPGQVAACLGLISDTHMPERWPELPGAIFDVFAGVDLILHAGDVGELWVLDRLSAIAPVLAVRRPTCAWPTAAGPASRRRSRRPSC
jgi:hypothetical protein